MQTLHKILHLIEYDIEEKMDEILAEMVTPISEFKKNPNLSVKRADGKPFAVLTNNKPSFYVLTPKVYDDLLEQVWELKIQAQLLAQIKDDPDGQGGVEVNLDDYL